VLTESLHASIGSFLGRRTLDVTIRPFTLEVEELSFRHFHFSLVVGCKFVTLALDLSALRATFESESSSSESSSVEVGVLCVCEW